MATVTIYGDASDGWIRSSAFVYATAREGAGTPTISNTSNTQTVGQFYAPGPAHHCTEFFLAFDTSSLGPQASVSDVELSVTSHGDDSATDFEVEARVVDIGATFETTDFVPGSALGALPLVATRSTTSWGVAGTVQTFASEPSFPDAVETAGFTRLVLSSSRHRLGTAPASIGNKEYVGVRAAEEAGTTSDPVLVLTYSVDAAAALTGAGSVTAEAVVEFDATAQLAATSSASASAERITSSAATLAAVAEMTADAAVIPGTLLDTIQSGRRVATVSDNGRRRARIDDNGRRGARIVF